MGKIPEGFTEQEVVNTILLVSERLAKRFRFGYHDVEDIKQQACMFAWEGLDNYDNERPLENFLWTHVKNRLCTYKRDNYERVGCPCDKCKNKGIDNDGVDSTLCIDDKEIKDKWSCIYYVNWFIRNNLKKNLMQPIAIAHVDDEKETNMRMANHVDQNIIYGELLELFNQNLPLHYRADFLHLINDVPLPKNRKEKLCEILQTILEEHNYEYD